MNNHNIVLAVLENKGIITHEEAVKLADFLNTSVIPSQYKDALTTVNKLLDPDDDEK